MLCWREQRHVGQQLTLSYERKLIMREETELTRGLVGQYVDTYAFADGRLEVRWKGVALPYRTFDKDQRVSQADVVENKRLSAVLAEVKEMQESRPPPRVKTNSEKNGYRKTGRRKRDGGPPGSACARPAEQSPGAAGIFWQQEMMARRSTPPSSPAPAAHRRAAMGLDRAAEPNPKASMPDMPKKTGYTAKPKLSH